MAAIFFLPIIIYLYEELTHKSSFHLYDVDVFY